jgi:hypothetical protein
LGPYRAKKKVGDTRKGCISLQHNLDLFGLALRSGSERDVTNKTKKTGKSRNVSSTSRKGDCCKWERKGLENIV